MNRDKPLNVEAWLYVLGLMCGTLLMFWGISQPDATGALYWGVGINAACLGLWAGAWRGRR
ncbi:hypothetical protein E1281_02065 [Actinomadura sp. KC345]|uniref:hypothetical protein n=1 Tax=Actinomadura sp. KC345 TaxID=2530371 RepID=UPI00104F045C|nr:hypothetical protein [Actinomadura sp. KC345]TDC58305.1 hypothetical protein E1281_02065 [Actinomadura sp. KC345]